MTLPASTTTRQFTPAQIDIIKKTCAPKTNNDEFYYFIGVAQSLGLNPLQRQILANVYNASSPTKRSVVIIVEIGGLRAIAARAGDYYPDSEDPVYEIDPNLVSDTNPKGIVKCSVNAFKLLPNGGLHRVRGTVEWDEFAAIEIEWKWGDQKGQKVYTGKKTLSDTWKKMPAHMIAKCAEAHALRKGWPEQVSGLYEHAEATNFDEDMLPTEVLEQKQSEDRQRAIGVTRGEYMMQFAMGDELIPVPFAEVHGRCMDYINSLETVMELMDFKARNKFSFQRYWAEDKEAGLNLNEAIEQRKAGIESAAAEAA